MRRQHNRDRLLQAASLLGVQVRAARSGAGRCARAAIDADDPTCDPARAARVARLIDLGLAPVAVAFITGASGSGKSLALRALAKRLARGGRACVWVDPRSPVVDARRTSGTSGTCAHSHAGDRGVVASLGGRDVTGWLRALATAGLGEAPLLAREPGELSEGQRLRLRVAMAMRKAGREAARYITAAAGARARRARRASTGAGTCANTTCATIIIDEFASTLDRSTACALATAAGRWTARFPGVRLVVATAHDDLVEALGASLRVRLGLDGGVEIVKVEAAPTQPSET
jgi:ABC-type ATPase with predicted acetyltransferase domain